MIATPKYNLYFVGATCNGCQRRYIRRKVAVMPALDTEKCFCGGEITYRKLGWKQYTRWMNLGATYREVEHV